MSLLPSVDPLLVVGLVFLPALARLAGLAIALRGTAPRERPAIIRALAEFFRLAPRRRGDHQARRR
ncbi:hypothetical protein [Allokutzneria albata]|uniref:Uncharacterized protein n=1 Tax=Allokutzneria albata TaxID=211114 RepID=A0A1H0DB80_ALLAB|nr:hypothetical protein [Allokutzneria albata]SDN67196.1 hypothetical protein SAMN04489726_7689 [Allokutzneria albata]